MPAIALTQFTSSFQLKIARYSMLITNTQPFLSKCSAIIYVFPCNVNQTDMNLFFPIAILFPDFRFSFLY